jgi:hypothetical protein
MELEESCEAGRERERTLAMPIGDADSAIVSLICAEAVVCTGSGAGVSGDGFACRALWA